jgi:threonine dehydrogenase-like Zn-dependent dehydrogenase
VEVAEHPRAELPPGHLRVRTRYSGISAGTELTAYRGTNPYLTRTWDAEARLFRDGSAGIAYPVAGWGYSEVGEVTEVSPELSGTPGLPAPGDLVWGIWGHRSEGVVPAERMIGHTLPAGLDPLAGAFARVGAIAYNAVLAGDIHVGEDVAVFGQGVIGLLTTRLAQLNGARVTAL